MKKLLSILALCGAAGAASYVYQQQSSNALPELAYVPDDVVIFSGQFEPFPILEYLKNYPLTYKNSSELDDLFLEMKLKEKPTVKFLASLAHDYVKSMASPEKFIQDYGLASELKGLFYHVGLLPVVRFEVQNPIALQQRFDEAKEASGIESSTRTEQGVSFTEYHLSHNNEQAVDLVLSIHQGWATLTLQTPFNSQQDLRVALAIDKPTQSLNPSYINDTQHKFKLDSSSLTVINYIELVKALTSANDNSLGRMLTKVLNQTESDSLDFIRNASCQKDLTDIISAQLPRTVIGTQGYDMSADNFSMNMLWINEVNDLKTVKTLSRLKGFIPSHISQAEQIFSYGIGIDIKELAPVLTSFWTRFTQAKFECELLTQAQAQSRSANPAMLGMMTGMVNGFKGASMSLISLDIDPNEDSIAPKALDALITFSADDPLLIFNGIKTFVPTLANLEIPADGSAVNVNDVLGLPADDKVLIEPEVALKGQHIVLYAGDKATELASKLATETIESNGFISLTFDSNRIAEFIIKYEAFLEQVDPEQASAIDIEELKNMNMHFSVDMNFTENGMESQTHIKIKN